MTTAQQSATRYVYGIVRADAALPEALPGLGPTGEVSTVRHGELAALVGELPEDRRLGSRDDLLAHHHVLDAVAVATTVLPMRFGAVLDSVDAADEELLAPHQDAFLAELAELDGRSQFTLRCRYERDTVLHEILDEDDGIRQLRDRAREWPGGYHQRIQLGEAVVQAMNRKRDDDARLVLDAVEEHVAAVVLRESGDPDDVLDAAFLIGREHLDGFDDALEGAGRSLAGRVRLRLLGPTAPYDFVGSGR